MADKPVYLTRQDLEKIQGAVDDVQRQVQRVKSNPVVPQDPPAPEVYIARSPRGGIAPMMGMIPGVQDCDIYRLVSGEVVNVALAKPVYNLSPHGLPGHSWIVATRDKFGHWLGISVLDPSYGDNYTGTGTGAESASSGSSADEKVKVTSADTTAGYLQAKILEGANVNITLENAGANEDLRIAAQIGIGTGTGTTVGSYTFNIIHVEIGYFDTLYVDNSTIYNLTVTNLTVVEEHVTNLIAVNVTATSVNIVSGTFVSLFVDDLTIYDSLTISGTLVVGIPTWSNPTSQKVVTEICRPDAVILALTSASIAGTNTPRLINWGSAEYDIANLWNNYTKIRIRRAGLYYVHAAVAFSTLGNATWIGIRIRKNGISWFGSRFPVTSTTSWGVETNRIYYCEAGDVLEVDVTHNSTSPTTLTAIDGLFDIHEIGSPYVQRVGSFPNGTTFDYYNCMSPSAACCETGEIGTGTGSAVDIGTGTGTGADSGVVSTACCATTPTSFRVTLANSSSCACLNGIVVTVTNTSTNTWTGSAASPSCTSTPVHVKVVCDGGVWKIGVKCGSAPSSTASAAMSSTCSPFSITFSTPILPEGVTCCTGSVTATAAP